MPTRYEIVREVSAGDFAESVVARQTPGGKEFFVKRLLPHIMEDDEFRGLYTDAARRAINLEHPNIVSVRDTFEDSGRFAVAFDLVPGLSLRQILNETMHDHVQIPLHVTCRILADVAAGIEYLHGKTDSLGQPILHSDLGPGSVLVGFDGTTKICDFGVCTVNAANFYLSPSTLRAKLAFAAPELVISTALNPRADIFSFGVLAWELVTGRRLFEGPTQAEVQQAVVERNAPSPRAIRPEVPEALDGLILSALAKNPNERIASMLDVRVTLELLLEEMGKDAGRGAVAAWIGGRFGQLQRSSPGIHAGSVSPHSGVASTATAAASSANASATPPTNASASSSTSAADRALGSANSPLLKSTGHDAKHARSPGKSANRQFVVYAFALLVTIAAGVATLMFLLSSSHTTSSASSASTSLGAKQVQLRVFVEPPGAQISIDGKVVAEKSDPGGAIANVEANRTVRLKVTRPGNQPYEEDIQAPATGQHNVRVRLSPTGTGAGSEPMEGERAHAGPTNDNLDSAAETSNLGDGAGTSVATTASADRAIPSDEDAEAQSEDEIGRPGRRRPIRRARRSSHNDTKRRKARNTEQTAPRATANAAAMGVLTLSFSPTNASVFVDGLPVSGRSPVRVSDLSPGPHGVKISASGFLPVETSVHVAAGQMVSRSVELERAPANLDIVSSPSGATVSIDGRPRGRTPLTGLELSALKTHRITLKLENHEAWEASLEPSPGRNPPVVATLTSLSAKGRSADGDTDNALSTASERDIAIPRSLVGRVPEGTRVFKEGCGGCHGSSAAAVSAQKYTAEQWSRYFAYRRHERAFLLKKQFSRSDLANVKAYLMSAAADVDRDRAAGVR